MQAQVDTVAILDFNWRIMEGLPNRFLLRLHNTLSTSLPYWLSWNLLRVDPG